MEASQLAKEEAGNLVTEIIFEDGVQNKTSIQGYAGTTFCFSSLGIYRKKKDEFVVYLLPN